MDAADWFVCKMQQLAESCAVIWLCGLYRLVKWNCWLRESRRSFYIPATPTVLSSLALVLDCFWLLPIQKHPHHTHTPIHHNITILLLKIHTHYYTHGILHLIMNYTSYQIWDWCYSKWNGIWWLKLKSSKPYLFRKKNFLFFLLLLLHTTTDENLDYNLWLLRTCDMLVTMSEEFLL